MQGFRIIKKKLNWRIAMFKLDVQEYCHGCAKHASKKRVRKKNINRIIKNMNKLNRKENNHAET